MMMDAMQASSSLAADQASKDRAEAAKQAAESARDSARMAAAQASADRIEAAQPGRPQTRLEKTGRYCRLPSCPTVSQTHWSLTAGSNL